jgi:hypothetical protein
MLIQEVFPGSTSDPGEDYVTLQMWSSGENQVQTHTLTIYDTGGMAHTASFPATPIPGVPNGANQSTILIGAASSVLGMTPDLVDADVAALDPAGGAACWETFDCVSWGTFTPPIGGLPSAAGAASSFSPDGSLTRIYNQHGCETLLEAVDDTNDSLNDLAGTLPVPRNNAAAPTEKACPNTKITDGPKSRTHDRTPTLKFKSIPGGAPSFRCAIDDVAEESDPCTSPFTLPRLSFGRHTFLVFAENSDHGRDPTPATQKFKVVKKH